MNIIRNILLNPGPATTTNSVKLAQVVPDICPREIDFGKVMEFISNELTDIVGDRRKYTSVLFGGSGTAVVEAMLSSAVCNGRVLIINNGAYGARMCQIAKAYQLNYVEYKSSSVAAVDLDDLKKTIKESKGKFTHLSLVHHETTTGLLTDIESIGKLCGENGIKMIVDAVSSFAAVPIDMEKMNISFMASTSNKNLQGMAGIGFVIANKEDLEALKELQPRNFYLNLYEQYKYFKKEYQMRFTPPVQTAYALKQAIIETQQETVIARYARYCKSWETLVTNLKRLGLNHLIEEKDHAKLITSIIEPNIETYSMEVMHDFFYERGYTIYPGKFSGMNTFRVANIGAIDYNDIKNFIILLEQYLKQIKYL